MAQRPRSSNRMRSEKIPTLAAKRTSDDLCGRFDLYRDQNSDRGPCCPTSSPDTSNMRNLVLLLLLFTWALLAPSTSSAYFESDAWFTPPQDCDFEFHMPGSDSGDGVFHLIDEHGVDDGNSSYSSSQNLIDLDALAQDFVLEAHQIHIPGFPDAFNPSIVRWQNRLLMSFRIRDRLTKLTHQIGLIWLDSNFQPEGDAYVLQIQDVTSKEQDPRLIVIGDSLYMIYSNLMHNVQREIRRMFVAEITFNGNQFVAKNPSGLFQFLGERSERWEKNWVPFIYDYKLLLGYSIAPHYIVQPLQESGRCLFDSYSLSDIHWAWGHLRGGTPALNEGEEYLAFFHSCKEMASQQSQGKKMTHYFMGAYTFAASPPFQITRISPEPIVGRGFYTSPPYRTWKPLRVVFPCGFVSNGDYVWISYGKQDHEIWIVKLDKKLLLKSLTPVSLVK